MLAGSSTPAPPEPRQQDGFQSGVARAQEAMRRIRKSRKDPLASDETDSRERTVWLRLLTTLRKVSVRKYRVDGLFLQLESSHPPFRRQRAFRRRRTAAPFPTGFTTFERVPAIFPITSASRHSDFSSSVCRPNEGGRALGDFLFYFRPGRAPTFRIVAESRRLCPFLHDFS